jgi:hypothetical protein
MSLLNLSELHLRPLPALPWLPFIPHILIRVRIDSHTPKSEPSELQEFKGFYVLGLMSTVINVANHCTEIAGESTAQLSHILEYKPLYFDRELATNWVAEIREATLGKSV